MRLSRVQYGPRNVSCSILDEFAPLYREPDFLLREELRELENYYGVLMALASGSQSNAEISRQGGINERNAHYYLQHLVELGYVSRRHPLTGRPPSARKVHFVLDDPLLRFWFRFVSPNIGFISRMGPERAFSELVRPQLESYFGHCFERLCREALPFLYEKERINTAFEVSECWDKNVQIDVVGHRRDHRIDIGECKWGTVRSVPSLVAELESKMEHYPNKDDATLQARIFTQKNSNLIKHHLQCAFTHSKTFTLSDRLLSFPASLAKIYP